MASDLADKLEHLLNELHQSVLTKKKDAISAFEEYYFRSKPKMNDAEIKVRLGSDNPNFGMDRPEKLFNFLLCNQFPFDCRVCLL